MKKVIIIGAGGHCKVVIDTLEIINNVEKQYEIVGVLDDNESNKDVLGYPILGRLSSLKNYDEKIAFHIAIGNNNIREKIYKENCTREFLRVIHPSATISKYAIIESGSFLGARTVVNPETRIGRGSIINTGSIIEHETWIEEFSHISYGVLIGANCNIKEKSFIDMGEAVKRNTNM